MDLRASRPFAAKKGLMNTPATSPSAGSGRPGRRLALASGLLLSLVLTTTPPTRAESVLFVAQTGTIYNDCLSAAQPCPTINAAINQALQDPGLQEQMRASGGSAGRPLSLEQAQEFFQRETLKYQQIARSIRLERQ